jgi:hypothetical protein
MELTIKEAENILNMLQSEDQDNAYVAFQAIEAFDRNDDYIGYLSYFYKFSKHDHSIWSSNAPKAYNLLKLNYDFNKPVTYAEALTKLIDSKVSKELIDMFLEKHVKDLSNILNNMGYPTDVVELKMKYIKEDVSK